jgi:hypothetical protein
VAQRGSYTGGSSILHSKQKTRFDYCFGSDLATEVRDLLLKPPTIDRYDMLSLTTTTAEHDPAITPIALLLKLFVT